MTWINADIIRLIVERLTSHCPDLIHVNSVGAAKPVNPRQRPKELAFGSRPTHDIRSCGAVLAMKCLPLPLVIRFGAVFMLMLSLAGCAVGMAASGKEPPNLAVCRIGASVTDIERELGAPVRSRDLPAGGQECIYEYELGNAPSPGRAVGHAAMDVVTFGLWEIIGTPLEMIGGSRYQLIVAYDAERRAREITSRRLE